MHWEGPISLALFAGGEEERLVLEVQLRFLRQCHAEIASTLSIHFAVAKTPRKGTWNLTNLVGTLSLFKVKFSTSSFKTSRLSSVRVEQQWSEAQCSQSNQT